MYIEYDKIWRKKKLVKKSLDIRNTALRTFHGLRISNTRLKFILLVQLSIIFSNIVPVSVTFIADILVLGTL